MIKNDYRRYIEYNKRCYDVVFNLIPAPEQTAGAGLSGVADTFIDIIQGVAYVLPVETFY